MNTNSQRSISLLALVTVLAIAPAHAHHSVAMYDADKLVTLDGTVKEFQWANPHVILRIEGSLTSATADPQLWTIEFTAPSQLARDGWTHSTLKVGDMVKIAFHPFRDGRLGGSFSSVTFPNGQEMKR